MGPEVNAGATRTGILPGTVALDQTRHREKENSKEEATAGLLAQIAFGHHVEDPLGQLPLVAHLVVDGGFVVAGHGEGQYVGPGQVGGAVGGGDGAGPGARPLAASTSSMVRPYLSMALMA